MTLDLERITHPLQLAKGSHQPGSGKGCAMNVVSYTNGDVQITDFPDCSAIPLSRIVQTVNDALANEVTGLLSPENSLIALRLGFRTVGTGTRSSLEFIQAQANWWHQLTGRRTSPYDWHFGNIPEVFGYLTGQFATDDPITMTMSDGNEMVVLNRWEWGTDKLIAFADKAIDLWEQMIPSSEGASEPVTDAQVNDAIERMLAMPANA
ncbi:hypothetical protein [Mycobacteroides abscessus]|uniref:hypothetical protein n=1 Tax=Mycobacteroides abscessus TaxID=36809 RepID=UPI00026837A7|nr:hypothetical protein [Mycobacteroides abscessus]EIT89467.1 hypothetical protein MA4S0303_3265 [Mycobacteroides abscessus 4S-0303]EIT91460.1 hypothetical protein MA4S0726RB_2789 [Mycobacteroides abscessus 4S-0726-RB]EIT95009.1 hypothetical protein MA4S0726RA_3199 [Mycobacteroides abscessus 4S-0726-RA]EIV07805.1 hypothetical protein MA4S0206_3283 [Mycobacteroides abscessus 4S-0206]EIV47268.1 hypothetical protein MA4S0116R_3239 [Mycobacteroides abscessus 4S-0116-R]